MYVLTWGVVKCVVIRILEKAIGGQTSSNMVKCNEYSHRPAGLGLRRRLIDSSSSGCVAVCSGLLVHGLLQLTGGGARMVADIRFVRLEASCLRRLLGANAVDAGAQHWCALAASKHTRGYHELQHVLSVLRVHQLQLLLEQVLVVRKVLHVDVAIRRQRCGRRLLRTIIIAVQMKADQPAVHVRCVLAVRHQAQLLATGRGIAGRDVCGAQPPGRQPQVDAVAVAVLQESEVHDDGGVAGLAVRDAVLRFEFVVEGDRIVEVDVMFCVVKLKTWIL